jgi:hypothetical protein
MNFDFYPLGSGGEVSVRLNLWHSLYVTVELAQT